MPRTSSIKTHPQRSEIETAKLLIRDCADVSKTRRVDVYVEWFLTHVPAGKTPVDVDRIEAFLGADDRLREKLRIPTTWRTPIPLSLRQKIISEEGQTCAYCGGDGNAEKGPDGKPWHVDHICPVALGGTDDRSNLALACATCNMSKGAMPAEEFSQRVTQAR